jgi:DNA repair protein RecO (recombination protein O)
MNYKTPGVIIKRLDFSEADRILTIFTERFGKVKAIARGVRKISSRLSGHLEPFMLVNLQLYEGKTFYTTTGSIIERDFPAIHSDLAKMADAFYIGELIDKFESEKQRSEKAFELLIKTLEALNSCSDPLVLRIFEVNILKIAGLWGDLFSCLHCREKLQPGENYWDGEEGGIICSKCQRLYHHGRPIANDTVKVFRLIESEGFGLLGRLNVPADVLNEIREILSIYLRHVLESDIRSERFIRDL